VRLLHATAAGVGSRWVQALTGKASVRRTLAFFATGGAEGGAFLFIADELEEEKEEEEEAGWWRLVGSLAPEMAWVKSS
jgi:hypothetical protein